MREVELKSGARPSSTSRLHEALGNMALLVLVLALCWLAGNAWIYHQRAIDERGMAVVIADEWPKDHDVVPSISPVDYIRHEVYPTFNDVLPPTIKMPLGAVPNVRTVYCQEDEGWYIDRTDRYGFFNPNSAWDNPIGILLIGDSFANGACTPRNSRFDLAKRVNTVTLGSGGNGPLMELATLREFLLKYKAKHIVWYVVNNDNSDLIYEIRYPPLKAYWDNPSYSQHYFDLDFSSWTQRALAAIPKYLQLNESDIAYMRAHGVHSEFYDVALGQYSLPLVREVISSWKVWVRNHLAGLEHAMAGTAGRPPKIGRATATMLLGLGLLPDILPPIHLAPKALLAKIFAQANSRANIGLFGQILDEARSEATNAGMKITFIFLPSKTTCETGQEADWYPVLMRRLQSRGADYVDAQSMVDHDYCSDLFAVKTGAHFSAYGYQRLAELVWNHLNSGASRSTR